MKQGFSRFINAVMVFCLLSSLFSISVSAAQYNYDELDRLTTVESINGEATHYVYDAAGNLLTVTTTASETGMAEANLSEGDGTADHVQEGWTPYFTSGIAAQYSVTNESIYGGAYEPSVVNDVYAGTSSPTQSVTQNVYDAIQEANVYPVQQIIASASRAGGANVYKDVRVTGQQMYSLSGWVKADQLRHSAVQVVVNYYDARNRLIGYENAVNVLGSSGWTNFNATLSAPTGAQKARIHLQLIILEAGGSGIASYAGISFEPYQAS